MRTLKLSSAIILLSLCAFSCGKSGDDNNTAGKGGNANLTLYLQHHDIAHNIFKGKVYIKYNTLDAPPNNIYDDSLTTSSPDTMQTATFTGLKNGNYYVFGIGCDTSIYYKVYAGTKYTISAQSNQSYIIPVSEDLTMPCN